jgi:RTA1 like protein
MCFFSVIISITSQGTSTFFSTGATGGNVSSGLALLKASLVIQLFLNVAFIAIVAFFHHRCSSNGIFQQSGERSTKFLTTTFYLFMAWIVVSDLFNTIQIFLPSSSSAWTTEAYFWVFSATPMLICTALLHILPPAKYFLDINVRYSCAGTSAEGQTNDFELGQNKRWC